MRTEDVKKLPVLDRWLYWITERESIRLKKEAGEPAPWTDDEVLQRFRFCNVRRMDDRVSRWLMDNWYTPFKDHPNMLAACALARFVNLPEALAELTDRVFPSSGSCSWSAVRMKLSNRKRGGKPVWNNAYMVSPGGREDKIDAVVNGYVRSIAAVPDAVDPASMEATHAKIMAVDGFGSFMAGQVVADLRWAVTGAWADRNSWAPVGPGSVRGLARIYYGDGWEAAAKVYVRKPGEFLRDLSNLARIGRERLPAKIADRLEMHDWQNTLCETDKFNRVLNGEGKPKQLYRGTK